jgi:glyoxylase-like metal-dependent hydrolase (beta-lactamase superfamily II)
VIDPGYTGSYRAVLRFLGEQQVTRLDWIILTHHHIDHAGTALALARATGARLAIHRDDARYLRPGRPRERVTLYGLVDRIPARLMPYLVSCADCDVEPLEDGQTIAGLTVLHAPGHTPGSICLWSESESVLFAGDVLNNERGVRTPPWTVNWSHQLARRAPSKLSSLAYERAYFGHGPAITADADLRIRAFLELGTGRSNAYPGEAAVDRALDTTPNRPVSDQGVGKDEPSSQGSGVGVSGVKSVPGPTSISGLQRRSVVADLKPTSNRDKDDVANLRDR